MTETTQFSLSALGIRNTQDIDACQPILEFIPLAALIIDSQSQRIFLANSKASELTAYTRVELSNLKLYDILPDLANALTRPANKGGVNLEEKTPFICELIKRNRVNKEVVIHLIRLPPKGKRLFLTVETPSPKPPPIEEQKPNEDWQTLIQLISCNQEQDLLAGMKLALQVSQKFTHASIQAIYLADGVSPTLLRFDGTGDCHLLPESIGGQELAVLSSAGTWINGKKPMGILQKAALNLQFSYLSYAPLGEPGAVIGLFICGDKHKQPDMNQIPIISYIAQSITTLIQLSSIGAQNDQLKANQERSALINQAIEENIQEAALVLKPDLTISRINQSAEEMLGYTNREVVGQLVENILIGSENLSQSIRSSQIGKTSDSLGNVHLYRRSGEVFPAQAWISPVQINNQLHGIVILLNDISEQEQIREQTVQLEQRAIIGEVTAVFSHEIRNPINNLSTGLEILELNLPRDDPNQAQIKRLQQDCDRLAELIKSILSVSRPTEYKMESLDPGKFLQNLLERLQNKIARANIQYLLQIPPNCPRISANARALEQVFSNLINNALDAMGENGGHLVIKIQPAQVGNSNSTLEITIADTGPGIPKENLDRIFQLFYTTKPDGNGIGLAVTKRIVTAHKGRIWATSIPGGTVFHVQFPILEISSS
jgi:PAS domain S-box-containing protein